MNLTGQNVFVSGGSRGIGAAIAKSCADHGARVAISYKNNKDKALEVLGELKGKNHIAVEMDLSNEESVESASKFVLEQFTEIHGLVNNAGLTRDQILLRMKTSDFDDVISSNLRGHFLVTKAFLKPMFRAQKGSIVHITSVVGQTGQAGQANYAASKAGLEAFSRSVAREMASRNIRSNCVSPGFIVTDMTDELGEAQKIAILNNIPMGRIAKPEEVALPVVFLLSECSSYMTGQTLSVNGGMFMN